MVMLVAMDCDVEMFDDMELERIETTCNVYGGAKLDLNYMQYTSASLFTCHIVARVSFL